MCTTTWVLHEGGYELLFNRDERPSRGAALAPAVHELRGTRAIHPTDPDGGGTWIGVNARGLGVCLLNGEHQARGPEETRPSRGGLVLALLEARDAEEGLERLHALDLGAYSGFRLALFSPGREPHAVAWEGQGLQELEALAPLVSSGYAPEGAKLARRAALEELLVDPARPTLDELIAFQRSHVPARGPLSPCMHGEHASTVSASRITVTADEVRFRYAAGPPCTTAFGEVVTLERAS